VRRLSTVNVKDGQLASSVGADSSTPPKDQPEEKVEPSTPAKQPKKSQKKKEKWDMTPEELKAASLEEPEEDDGDEEEAPLPTCESEMTKELLRLGRNKKRFFQMNS